MPLCDNYKVEALSYSDHCLLAFNLGKKHKAAKWNWKLWKFTSGILKDETFKTRVNELFTELHSDVQMSWGVKWDLFKEQVEISAIERSTVINKQRKKNENDLHQQLKALLLEESINAGEFAEEVRVTKNKREAIDTERYRGAIVRARADKLWFGEMPNKRALADEKRYAQRNEIKEIQYRNNVTANKEMIERAFVEYYTELLGRHIPADDDCAHEFIPLMPKRGL